MTTAYTLEDLSVAQERLASAQARWNAYDGNNPNKHRALLAQAKEDLYRIEKAVKQSRLVPLSPHEELEQVLDMQHPNARSGAVVEYAEKKYVKKYTPGAHTLSGHVKFWIESWSAVE